MSALRQQRISVRRIRLRAKSYFGKQKKRNPETSDPFPGAIRKIRLHRNYHACITDFFHPPQRTGRCLHKILVGMNIQIECKAYRKAAVTEGGGNCGSGNPNETPWRSDKENRTQVPYQTPVEINRRKNNYITDIQNHKPSNPLLLHSFSADCVRTHIANVTIFFEKQNNL